MKASVFLLLFGLSMGQLFSQENADRHFYVTITDANSLTVDKKNGMVSISNKEDRAETAIYKKYRVSTFKIAYPNTDRNLFKNVYHITTNNEDLLKELQQKYPKK